MYSLLCLSETKLGKVLTKIFKWHQLCKFYKNAFYFTVFQWWCTFCPALFPCVVPPTVVSDTGCSLSSILGEDKGQSETGRGGTFLSWLTQNKREELQDKTAEVTHYAFKARECGGLKIKQLLFCWVSLSFNPGAGILNLVIIRCLSSEINKQGCILTSVRKSV